MQQAQPIVRGFAGENRLLTDDNLPDNIAVDGLNNDYSRATIRRREGFTKLHAKAILQGGVHIKNTSSNACVYIPKHDDYGFSAGTIEFVFQYNANVSGTDRPLITCRNDTGGLENGWEFRINTSNEIVFTARDGAAWDSATVSPTGGIITGRAYHVAGRATAGGDMTVMVTEVVSGSSTTSSTVARTNAVSLNRPIYIGADLGIAPANTTNDIVVQEFRIWHVVRTDTEIADRVKRQLAEDEIADASLVGYWQMTDGQWNICNDKSINRNHGLFYTAGPSFEPSMIPFDSDAGSAIRCDGIDDYGTAPYHADYAPVLNTGTTWTVEAWVRLDINMYDDSLEYTLLQLGNYATDGAVFSWHINWGGGVYPRFILRFSTATTYTNEGVDPSVEIAPGVPVHIATVRETASITVYVNGSPVYTAATFGTEAGPTTSTDYGMTFCARDQSGSFDQYAPVTLDDVRVWKTARSGPQIQAGLRSRYPNATDDNLIGYWRFDTDDKEKDETGRSAITFNSDGTKPVWGEGLIMQSSLPRILLAAPLIKSSTDNETLVSSGQSKREVLVATATGFWSLIGDRIQYLRDMYTPGEPTLFDWCHYKGKLICVNGIEENTKYDGASLPRAVSLATPSAAPSAATGGAGNLTGNYYYRVSFRNSNDGTESLASAASSVVSPSSEEVDLSSIPVSTDPQVNQRRLYRLDPSASVYRYLADIDDNTTTTYTDDDADISTNEAIDDRRGHAQPARYCAVYGNRLFLANESKLIYSEANDESAFTATNIIYVDRGDGDRITGIISAFGGLVIFKQRSIHFLIGEGPDSYQLSKLVTGQGCVSGHTIQGSAQGIYFIGYDGAYVMTGPAEARPISVSQQPLFQAMDAEQYHYNVSVYDAFRHLYIASIDLAQVTNGRYYTAQPELFRNYWPLNGDGDDLAGNNDLSATGAPVYVTDTAYGTVVKLDGASDYLSATYSAFNGEYTFGVWIRPSSTATGTDKLIAQLASNTDAPITLYHYRYGEARAILIGDNNRASPIKSVKYSLESGAWYHVVVTGNDDVARIYINGNPVAELEMTSLGGTFDGTGTFYLGGNGSYKNDCLMHNAFYSEQAFTPSKVRDIYNYESNQSYVSKERITMAYDEETQSWAKWDLEPDRLLSCSPSGNVIEVLLAQHGFIYRLFDGYRDGSDYIGLGSFQITRSGSLSANGTNTISNASYVFPRLFDALAGTPLLTVGANGEEQRLVVVSNDSDTIWLNRPLEPAVTGTWYLAPIKWNWESRWMDLGDPAYVKRIYRFMAWLTEDSTTTITMKLKSDSSETWQNTTFTTEDEFTRIVSNHRGRKFKVRFEAYNTSYEKIEIQAFQLMFAQRKDV